MGVVTRIKMTQVTSMNLAAFAGAASSINQKYLLAAAELIAVKARANAAKFSRRIPGATHARPKGPDAVVVITDGMAAPNAAPFEFGKRHPLFGDRTHWYKQPTRAYISRAY